MERGVKEEMSFIMEETINIQEWNTLLPFEFDDVNHKFEDLSSIVPATFNSLPDLSPSTIQGDTMDIADKCLIEAYNPEMKLGPPERGVFKGEYNFEVQVNSSDVHKRKYLYSSKLNRIYVDMGSNFSMEFRWDFPRAPARMFVRAAAVFSDQAQAEKRVERCLQHKHTPTSDPSTVDHVLRSTRESNMGVYYSGQASQKESWYSVVVEYSSPPDDGSQVYSHAYQFVCKNSCSTGINRRSIDIVFTLEDNLGLVHGRQSVGARVCACPRRDMVRDEDTETVTKRRVKHAPPPPAPHDLPLAPLAKKVKLELDEEVYTLPAGIQIVGAKTLTTGLTVMKNMMEQMSSYKTDQKAKDKINKSIAGLNSLLGQFRTGNAHL